MFPFEEILIGYIKLNWGITKICGINLYEVSGRSIHFLLKPDVEVLLSIRSHINSVCHQQKRGNILRGSKIR